MKPGVGLSSTVKSGRNGTGLGKLVKMRYAVITSQPNRLRSFSPCHSWPSKRSKWCAKICLTAAGNFISNDFISFILWVYSVTLLENKNTAKNLLNDDREKDWYRLKASHCVVGIFLYTEEISEWIGVNGRLNPIEHRSELRRDDTS